MSAVILGTGPRAMRVYLRSDGAQLRCGPLIVDLNEDAARLVRLVLECRPEEVSGAKADYLDTGTICSFLTALSSDGIPLALWGNGWADFCEPSEGTGAGLASVVR